MELRHLLLSSGVQELRFTVQLPLAQVKAQAAKRKNGNKAHNGQNADHRQQLDHCEAGACRFAPHCFVVMTGKTGYALLL